MGFTGILGLIQMFFAVVIGLYFNLRGGTDQPVAIDRESRKEMEELERLRQIHLTEPLGKTRPATFKEIIGQENGLNRSEPPSAAQPPACNFIWASRYRQDRRRQAGAG